MKGESNKRIYTRQIKPPFNIINPTQSIRPPTPEERLQVFDPEYVNQIKGLRAGAKGTEISFMSVCSGIKEMLMNIEDSANYPSGRNITNIDFAAVWAMIKNSLSNDTQRSYRYAIEEVHQELAIDILNAALQSLLRERKLEVNCTYEFDYDKYSKANQGFNLVNRFGKRIVKPEFSKEELIQKVHNIREINSLLFEIEFHQEKINECIKDIVDVLKNTPKQQPQKLVESIRAITEKYTNREELSPREIENVYTKASELSKNAIKEAARGNNFIVKLLDNIKEFVCSIFGKSASQQVDKLFSELKQDLANETQSIQQPSGRGK